MTLERMTRTLYVSAELTSTTIAKYAHQVSSAVSRKSRAI